MSTYTVQDITNRLEALDTYLDDLEMQLNYCRDAHSEMEEIVEDLADLEKIQDAADDFCLPHHLLTDLHTYRAQNGGAWDYKTAALFDTLETLLRKLETILA